MVRCIFFGLVLVSGHASGQPAAVDPDPDTATCDDITVSAVDPATGQTHTATATVDLHGHGNSACCQYFADSIHGNPSTPPDGCNSVTHITLTEVIDGGDCSSNSCQLARVEQLGVFLSQTVAGIPDGCCTELQAAASSTPPDPSKISARCNVNSFCQIIESENAVSLTDSLTKGHLKLAEVATQNHIVIQHHVATNVSATNVTAAAALGASGQPAPPGNLTATADPGLCDHAYNYAYSCGMFAGIHVSCDEGRYCCDEGRYCSTSNWCNGPSSGPGQSDYSNGFCPSGSVWVGHMCDTEEYYAYRCGMIDGIHVSCGEGRYCSTFNWCNGPDLVKILDVQIRSDYSNGFCPSNSVWVYHTTPAPTLAPQVEGVRVEFV